MATQLAQVTKRTLVKQSPVINLSQVVSRSLIYTPEINVISYTKTAREYLISALKYEDLLPFKDKYFEFGPPLSSDGAYNTEVLVTLLEGSGAQGSKVLYYDRAPIEHILVGKDIREDFKPKLDALVTTRDLLREFNTKYSTKIPLEDILDVEMIQGEDVIFTATADSYFFIPGSTVNLGVIKGSDKYAALPTDTLTWSPELLEGVWTQGLDISLMYKGLTSNAVYVSTISDEFIRQFYDDVSQAPTSKHPRVTGRPLTQRSTTAPVISDRARTDCIYAVTVIPLGTTVPVIFHYDSRQR